MENIKKVTAANIIKLRKANNMTQLELAEALNYSDKAISKWERGEALPDVGVLKEISNIFSVTVDYLISEHNDEKVLSVESISRKDNINKLYLTLLCASPIWIIAITVFVMISIFIHKYVWFVFYISVPITSIIFLIFNSIFGNKRLNYLIVSIFIWTLITSLYFTFFNNNLWQLFLLGLPAQIVIILWSKLRKNHVMKKKLSNEKKDTLE